MRGVRPDPESRTADHRSHCRTDPARRHGPYWQWSRSIGGTTRTTRLSEAEARLYREWIANRRRAERILAELEDLSAEAAPSLLGAHTSPEPVEPPAGD